MIEVWGEAPDGSPIHRVCLSHKGTQLNIISFGAAVQHFGLSEFPFSFVLGYSDCKSYLDNPNYFGSIIGRCANRIRNAQIQIEDRVFHLDRNFLGDHHVHGGSKGTAFSNWIVDGVAENYAQFSIVLPDGHMGYPGQLIATAKYSIVGTGRVQLEITATASQVTLCNFASHCYFNLDGTRSIKDHELKIFSEKYLQSDEFGFPLGLPVSARGTKFDFTTMKSLQEHGFIFNLDQNFCFNQHSGEPEKRAELFAKNTGLRLKVSSTEVGLQVYTGSKIRGSEANSRIQQYSGIALEPQGWPDAANNSSYPSIKISPNLPYKQTTVFEVYCEK